MSLEILVHCPACGGAMAVQYSLLGAPLACESCGSVFVAQVSVGATYPTTGFEVTFGDFQDLLHGDEYRSVIGQLLAEWYGYEIQGTGDETGVYDRGGDRIDTLELHRRIQADRSKQGALYRVAMTFWR